MTSHYNLLMLFIGEERIFLELGYSCHFAITGTYLLTNNFNSNIILLLCEINLKSLYNRPKIYVDGTFLLSYSKSIKLRMYAIFN